MTTRKRARTAQIKPATREAIMDQLALAADEIERLNRVVEEFHESGAWELGYNSGRASVTPNRSSNQFWLGLWLLFFGVIGMVWLVTI